MNKTMLFLGIFGLVLIGILAVLPHGEATVTYNQATDTLTQVGATTNNFHQIWQADKAGILKLKSQTTTTANTTYSLDIGPRPADDLSLPITMNISTWTQGSNQVLLVCKGLNSDGVSVMWYQNMKGAVLYRSDHVTDQEQVLQDSTIKVGESNGAGKYNMIAQSFVANNIKIFGIKLYKQADTGTFTGTVTISLYTDTAGVPGSYIYGITITNAVYKAYPVGEFTTLFTTLPNPLTIGTTYWIRVSTSTANDANHPNLGYYGVSDLYASGTLKWWNTADGWTEVVGDDLYFRTIVDNIAFASVSASGISLNANVWSGNVIWNMTQPRWGVVWKNRQPGYTTTTEGAERKQFYFKTATIFNINGTITDADDATYRGLDVVFDCNIINVYGTINLGYLSTNNPRASWRMYTRQASDGFRIQNGGILNLKGGVVTAGGRWRVYGSGQYNMDGIIFEGIDGIELDPAVTGNNIGTLKDVTWTQATSGVGFKCFQTPLSTTRLMFKSNLYGIQVLVANSHPVLRKPVFTDNTNDIIMNTGDANRVLTLVDCMNGTGAWYPKPKLNTIASGATVLNKFTVERRVVNETGVGIAGATWNLSNDYYTYINVTNATGYIQLQEIVAYRAIETTTWSDYSQYNEMINASGYETYAGKLFVQGRVYGAITLEEPENNTNLTITENLVNCTVTHDSVYNSLTGWHIWINGSSPLFWFMNIINASVTHENQWTGSQQNLYVNGTGNTTPIHLIESNMNVTGTHTYILNGTGYWVTASYSSPLNFIEYLINCYGTHEHSWDGSQQNIYLNYTGTGGGGSNITILNPNPADGTTTYDSNFIQEDSDGLGLSVDFNSTVWTMCPNYKMFFWYLDDGAWYGDTVEDICDNGTVSMFFNDLDKSNYTYIWYVQVYNTAISDFVYTSKNFTFTTSPNHNLAVTENLVNCTGAYYITYDNFTGYHVYNNYIGYNALNFIEHLVKAYGTHQEHWTGTSWTINLNYTGTGADLFVDNPNPANGTLGYNFIQRNPFGVMTGVDVAYRNFTDADTWSLYENYNGTGGSSSGIVGDAWAGQTFINTNRSFILKSIQFPFFKGELYNGNLTVHLRAYSDNQTDISTGVIPVSSIGFFPPVLNTVNMSPVIINADERYMLVCSVVSNGSVIITPDSTAGYSFGNFTTSIDGGLTWTEADYIDVPFKIFGLPLMNITFSSNNSGVWCVYNKTCVLMNGTVSVLNMNMTDVNTQYWWRVTVESNGMMLNNETWTFTTGRRHTETIQSEGISVYAVGSLVLVGAVLAMRRRKNNIYK